MTGLRYALLATLALVLSGCARSPESTVEGFYEALAEGQISEARSYLAPQVTELLGEQKTQAVIASEAERIQGCGGIQSIETEISGEGEIRSGTVTIDYKGDCETQTEKLRLTQSEGKWLIGASK